VSIAGVKNTVAVIEIYETREACKTAAGMKEISLSVLRKESFAQRMVLELLLLRLLHSFAML